jgi:hypothetical protein
MSIVFCPTPARRRPRLGAREQDLRPRCFEARERDLWRGGAFQCDTKGGTPVRPTKLTKLVRFDNLEAIVHNQFVRKITLPITHGTAHETSELFMINRPIKHEAALT